MKYYLVDDSCTPLGGTALTLNAIVRPEEKEVKFISTSQLTKSFCEQNDPELWIFGNIMMITEESYEAIKWVMENKKFVKIEFDYGYCQYRGPVCHQVLSGGEKCDCPNPQTPYNVIYSLIGERASHIFFMSNEQMEMHAEALKYNLKTSNRYSVLTSCFSPENLDIMRELKRKKKNGKYAVIDGQGGWHSMAKGVEEALNVVKGSDMPFELLKTETHLEMLHKLSDFSCLVFLPLIHDTCPRVTIEAKLMGVGLITNVRSQHVSEYWWKQPVEQIEKYISERPKIFCQKISSLIS